MWLFNKDIIVDEILELYENGKNNVRGNVKAVAKELNISVSTVRYHLNKQYGGGFKETDLNKE